MLNAWMRTRDRSRLQILSHTQTHAQSYHLHSCSNKWLECNNSECARTHARISNKTNDQEWRCGVLVEHRKTLIRMPNVIYKQSKIERKKIEKRLETKIWATIPKDMKEGKTKTYTLIDTEEKREKNEYRNNRINNNVECY